MTGGAATSLQRAMLLASMKGGAPPPYHLQLAIELEPAVGAGALREAWQRVVARHEALRTRFLFEGTGAVAAPAAGFPWNEVETDVEEALRSDWVRPFEIGGDAPLWRATLVSGGGRRIWVLAAHHAIIDLHSYSRLLPELFSTCEALSSGRAPGDADHAPSFLEHAAWQQERDWSGAEAFWRSQFRGFDAPSAFASMHGVPREASTGTIRFPVAIPEALGAAIRDAARDLGVTVNTMVQAAWAIWLARTNGEGRALFGAVRACRHGGIEGADRVVGPMLNTLPLCVDVPESVSIAEWLRGLRRQWLELRDVEHCPLERIHACSGFDASTPPFLSAINFQRTTFEGMYRECGLERHGRLLFLRQETDLALGIAAHERPLPGAEIVFKAERVDAAYAQQAARSLSVILESIASNPERMLGEVELLSSEERRSVAALGQGPRRSIDAEDACVLFERAVARHPQAPSLVQGTRTWTYAELDAASGAVAANLAAMGIREGSVVGAVMAPSPEIAVAMLGIMRCGAAFLLVNQDLPDERRATLLQRAGVAAVVTMEGGAEGTLRFGDLAAARNGAPARSADVSRLAYLVHTSGTTGDSKFVQIEQRSFANFLCAIAEIYGLRPGDRRLQRAQPGSDFFIAEIMANLVAGSTVVFHEATGAIGVAEYLRLLDELGITVTGIPGSYWHEWVRTIEDAGEAVLPRRLRLAITGMEKIDAASLRRWHAAVGGRVEWLNVYGPSETTGISTTFRLEADLAPGRRDVPIGKPIANTSMHVLDDSLRPMPVGMAGEFFIGGAGLMRGYAGTGGGDGPFVADPHGSGRLYRTGDIGFLAPDGNFVFLGRRDNQVKIRGHRIELEAVESALSEIAGGCNAVAMVDDRDGQQALCALVESSRSVAEPEMKAAMRHRVPAAMVPSRIATVERLPRLPSGKIDRRRAKELLGQAITAIASKEPIASHEADGPEAAILTAFRRALQRPDLAATDDFFDAGGDSLAAVRAVADIEDCLEWQPPLRDIYVARNARELAALFRAGSRRGTVHCTPMDGAFDLEAGHHVLAVPPAVGTFPKYELLQKYWNGAGKLWSLEQEPPARDAERYPIPWLAANYVARIGELFRGRAITLTGYSVGALVAWEVATLLAGSHIDVRCVILLEPPTPGLAGKRDAFRRLSLPAALAFFVAHTRSLPLRERAKYFQVLLKRFARRRYGRGRGKKAPERRAGDERPLDQYQRILASGFEPRRFEGRVCLLRGQDMILSGIAHACDRYWAERCRDFQSFNSFGNHYQMLSEPDVRLNVPIVARIADEAAAGPPLRP